MVTRERSDLQKTWQLANYQNSAENDSDGDTHSFLFMPACFGEIEMITLQIAFFSLELPALVQVSADPSCLKINETVRISLRKL